MLQNVGNPFLKREKKLENIICKYLNIHLCIYKSSVHLLVSSCYNSYGVLETSRNSWRHKNQLLASKLEILHGFNLACWFQMLAPYPLLPPYCKKLWGVSLFHMFFLGTKILFAMLLNHILRLTPTDENLASKKASPKKKNPPCPCPFRILDPTICLSLPHNKIHRTQYVLPAIEVGTNHFWCYKKNINKSKISSAAAYIQNSFKHGKMVWNLKPSSTSPPEGGTS